MKMFYKQYKEYQALTVGVTAGLTKAGLCLMISTALAGLLLNTTNDSRVQEIQIKIGTVYPHWNPGPEL